MTDAQSNRLDMYLVVEGFYGDNQVIIDAVPARIAAFSKLKNNIQAINKEIAGQSSNTTGVALDKTALRNKLDSIAAITLASARTWASVMENNTLVAEFNYPISEIQRIKDDTVIGFCNHRISLINDNLASMADYGIDAATITEWQTALNDYQTVLESPREAVNTRHLHTETLKALFTDTANLFKDQLDPLMLAFKASDPLLYSAYRQARIIINRNGGGSNGTPTNDLKVTGTVSDAQTSEPIVGAAVTFTSPISPEPYTIYTDNNGFYRLEFTDVPVSGTITATVLVSAINYQETTQTVEATAGNSYTLDFSLTPAVVP